MNKERITGYRFPADISKKLNTLSNLDNYHGIIAMVQNWVIVIISASISQHCFYLYPIAIIIIGSRQRSLTTLLHDSAHGSLAKNKTLNLLLGTVFSGYWLFQSMLRYKASHIKRHHIYLGDKNLDPDFQLYIDSGLYKNINYRDFLLKHILSTLLMLKVPRYFMYLLKNRISSAKLYPFEFVCMFLCWLPVILFAYTKNSLQLIFLYWLVPFFTTHMIIGYFIEIAEHYPLLGSSNDIIDLTRNRFSHWTEGLLFSIHNENYHLVHHLRPNIPFWNMRKAHKVMMQDYKYRFVNYGFGGVFLSGNNAEPLFRCLMRTRFKMST